MNVFRFGMGFLACAALVMVAAAQDATPEEPLEAGDVREDEFGISQVYVPSGCFLMGTSDEEAEYAKTLPGTSWAIARITTEQVQHEACLSAGYWIDQYEVTNAAFQAFVDADGYTTPELWSEDGLKWLNRQRLQSLPARCTSNGGADYPRACVTWFEAEAYATWRGGTLPTEAQWEYAARGPESLIFPWGDEWDALRANVIDSTDTTAVGSYPDGVSWVGAYDLSGNVMEWISDWVRPNYAPESVTDPIGPEISTRKAEKGGWWGSNPVAARAAYQHYEDPPTYKDHHIGFRIVTAVMVEQSE